ncbi:MAG TPA: hypothetical protein VGL37_01790 [Solirubrobacteraceae bacterium]|jgi:hypothetical protein
MIDPLSLSVAALLAKALGGAAEETGREAADALGRLLATVRGRFSDDKPAQQALTAVERAPADEANTRELAAVLQERISADPSFGKELEGLLAEAERDASVARFVTEVRDNAHVGKVVNIGRARDVSF